MRLIILAAAFLLLASTLPFLHGAFALLQSASANSRRLDR
jgi:hypothetical protein